MAKSRNPENRGLPTRWQYTHGAYYFRVPPGLEKMWSGKKRFRLGATLPEAYKAYAARISVPVPVTTIGALLDRYAIEVVPTKAPKTRTENARHLKMLRAVFGSMPLLPFPPRFVYTYATKRGTKVAAHREIEVLSHAFTKAVEWGIIDRHPFKGEVRLKGEKPRTRYVEDWEVVELLALPNVRRRGSILAIQAYIRLKLLTGLRQGDLLRLRTSDLRESGIHVTIRKTGKRVIYDWSAELQRAVDDAKEARPVDIAPWLFCTRKGECYVDEEIGEARGWRSMWQRFMDRVLAETSITERFTEHDLRAKVASDADSLERARALLAHADARTTEAIYRRRPERVKPAG